MDTSGVLEIFFQCKRLMQQLYKESAIIIPIFQVRNTVWKSLKKSYICIYIVNVIITLMATKMKEKINDLAIQTNQTVLIF